MKVFSSTKKMQNELLATNDTVALVPTMGALHQGHFSLVKLAQKKAQKVVVSIFVNPIQFGPKEDLSKYPRTLKQDLKALKDLNVDYVFTPTVDQMYPDGFKTSVCVSGLTNALCGKSRPGHFDGVCTVVLKLLQITQPQVVVFGKKDYQQYMVIQKMVKDLNIPTRIIGAPLVREKDGLALSSRNKYLSSQDRQDALNLSQSLKKAKTFVKNQKKTPLTQDIKKQCLNHLKKNKRIQIDYVECLDSEQLNTIKFYKKNKTLLAIAVRIGKTRLIDNMVF